MQYINRRPPHPRVLAIYPNTKGFGYAVFEGSENLLDWGTKSARKNGTVTLDKIKQVIGLYHPESLILEDMADLRSRRGLRARRLIEHIVKLANTMKIRTYSVSRPVIRNAFAYTNSVTKHQIAATLAKTYPELSRSLPPKRKPWETERQVMSVFAAAALGVAYFCRREKRSATLT